MVCEVFNFKVIYIILIKIFAGFKNGWKGLPIYFLLHRIFIFCGTITFGAFHIDNIAYFLLKYKKRLGAKVLVIQNQVMSNVLRNLTCNISIW